MKKSSLILFCCGVLMLMNFSWAFAAGNFYSTEVAVANKSDAERTKGLIAAYKQVLSNFSKDSKVINSPEIKAKLKDISMWVQSYSYTRHPGADGKPGLFLKVNFDAQSIPEQLRTAEPGDAGNVMNGNVSSVLVKAENNVDETAEKTTTASAAVVGASSGTIATSDIAANVANSKNAASNAMPNVATENEDAIYKKSNLNLLVWLATVGDNAKTNVIIDDSNTKPTKEFLEKTAQKTGFSVILPAMDLQEIAKITADDVCDQDINVIKNASNRYGANQIAIGCIVQTDDGKHAQWMLLTEEQVYHWDLKGSDEAAILQQAFDNMVKILMPAKTIKPETVVADQNTPSSNVVSTLNSSSANNANAQQLMTAQKTEPRAPTLQPQLVSQSTAATTVTSTTSATNNTMVSPSPTHISDSELITNPNQVILNVSNINNLDQYASVVQYIHAIAGVTKVELLNINLSNIKLKISINSGKNALINGLSSQRKLTPNSGQTFSAENSSELNYNWIP